MNQLANNIHLAGRTLVIEGRNSLTLIDPGYDAASKGSIKGTSVEDIINFSNHSGKKIETIVISHAHGDHTANLDFYKYLNPTVIAHGKSPLNDIGRRVTLDTAASLSGVNCHFLTTPGHSRASDDISVYFPQQKLVFTGDICQPQGDAYNNATGVSPVTYFYDGNNYFKSLNKLLDLDANTLVTGHSEVFRGPAAKNALLVTHHTTRRMKELAQKLSEDHPAQDPDNLCEWIFDTIVHERNYDKARAAERKKTKMYRGLSYYQLYDTPGSLYFLKQCKSK